MAGIQAISFGRADSANVQRKLEEQYTLTKKKGSNVAPVLILTTVGAIAGGRLTKVLDNQMLNKLVGKLTKSAGELAKPVTDAVSSGARKAGWYANVILPKKFVKFSSDAIKFAQDNIIAFSKLTNESDSVIKGVFRNGLPIAGAITGLKISLTDKNGNGVRDIEEKLKGANNTFDLALGACEVLGGDKIAA